MISVDKRDTFKIGQVQSRDSDIWVDRIILFEVEDHNDPETPVVVAVEPYDWETFQESCDAFYGGGFFMVKEWDKVRPRPKKIETLDDLKIWADQNPNKQLICVVGEYSSHPLYDVRKAHQFRCEISQRSLKYWLYPHGGENGSIEMLPVTDLEIRGEW